MFGDSIPIPANRIPAVADESANTAKLIAAMVIFIDIILVLIVLGSASDPSAKSDDAVAVGPMLFFVVLIASIAVRFVKTANRCSAAIARAKADPASQWFLSGKMIVGSDAAGAPSPALTFKISRKSRTMLLAVPTATVVESGKLAP